MKITWRGHACFVVESSGYCIMLDPYHEVTGLEDISGEANEVLCSHGHHDHCYVEKVRIMDGVSPFAVERLDTFHDDREGALRGKNTIHILEAERLRVVHLGDLGHMPSEEQEKKLAGCDVLMIPIGGTYTLDSAQAALLTKRLKPRVVIPMHYRDGKLGYEVLECVDSFLRHFPDAEIHHSEENSLIIDQTTAEQIAVLRYQG